MNAARCGVERGSASLTSPPVTAPAARDHVDVPRATAAPGSRRAARITLPPTSTKSVISTGRLISCLRRTPRATRGQLAAEGHPTA